MGKADLNTNQLWTKLDAMDGTDGKITKKIWNAFAAIARGKTINYYITEGPNTNSHKYDSDTKKRHDKSQADYKRLLHEDATGAPSKGQKQDYKSLNSDNIMYFLKDKDTLKKIISKADKQTLGYSKSARENKIALIKPIVDSLCQRAIDFKIDKKYVENIRKICYEEINATFYTDAKRIGNVLCELFDKIRQKGG